MNVKDIRVKVMDKEADWEDLRKTFALLDEGKKIPFERSLVFHSIELMRKFLTIERLRMLKVIKHEKPQSIYELAKILARDRKSVTKDIHILEVLGFVELNKTKSKSNRWIVTPTVTYDRINIAVEV